MGAFFTRAIQIFGLYRAVDVAFSIWSGKSLLAIAILSAGSAMIGAAAEGFQWAHLPYYVLLAASIFAVMTIGWLTAIVSYRKISPKHKFAIPHFNFGCDPTPGSAPITASRFQATVKFINLADFPISYRIKEMQFVVQNTLSPGSVVEAGSEIDAGQSGQFGSGIVTLHHPVQLPVEGSFTFKIVYGKPGREKFKRSGEIGVLFSPDAAGTGVKYEWWYARRTE